MQAKKIEVKAFDLLMEDFIGNRCLRITDKHSNTSTAFIDTTAENIKLPSLLKTEWRILKNKRYCANFFQKLHT